MGSVWKLISILTTLFSYNFVHTIPIELKLSAILPKTHTFQKSTVGVSAMVGEAVIYIGIPAKIHDVDCIYN